MTNKATPSTGRQTTAVEFTVTGSLDGLSIVPPELVASEPAGDPQQLHRFTVTNLGLIDVDFLVEPEGPERRGARGNRLITSLYIHAPSPGVLGARVAVVDAVDETVTPIELEEIASLAGEVVHYNRNGIYIPQGAMLQLVGMVGSSVQPVKVRYHYCSVDCSKAAEVIQALKVGPEGPEGPPGPPGPEGPPAPLVFPAQWLLPTDEVRALDEYFEDSSSWRRTVYNSDGEAGAFLRVTADNDVLDQWAWLLISDTDEDQENKAGRFGTPAYVTAQLPVTGVVVTSLPTLNTVNLGGGSNNRGQAATRVSFWSATTVDTPTGTEQIRMDGSGHLLSWNPGRNLGAAFARWGAVIATSADFSAGGVFSGGVSASSGSFGPVTATTGSFSGGVSAGAANRVGTNGFATLGTWALFSDNELPATTKAARLGLRPWNMTQDPVILLLASALQTLNTLNFGGGSVVGQAATRISFWTAPAVNALGGTEQLRLDGNGHLLSINPGRNLGGPGAGFAALFFAPFTDATRPAPGIAGRVIFNTSDGNLNIDDGAQWILPDGSPA